MSNNRDHNIDQNNRNYDFFIFFCHTRAVVVDVSVVASGHMSALSHFQHPVEDVLIC